MPERDFVQDNSANTALLLIDVINDLEFDGGDNLLLRALPMAGALAALKRRAKALGIPGGAPIFQTY